MGSQAGDKRSCKCQVKTVTTAPLLQMDRQSMQLQAVAHYVDAGLSERAFTAQAVERTLPGPLQGNVNVSGVRTCRTRMVTP